MFIARSVMYIFGVVMILNARFVSGGYIPDYIMFVLGVAVLCFTALLSQLDWGFRHIANKTSPSSEQTEDREMSGKL